MPKLDFVRECPVEQTARVLQLAGMFDLPATKVSRTEWQANLPIEQKPWNIGLIVGPSGCGKSTLAREMFGKFLCNGFKWDARKSIVDGFPSALGIKDLTLLLSSVGFSSPPSWLRPFQVLSNGEQFRVTIARALAEAGPAPVVIDEFTSVVDRTVAKIGSAAVAKTIRKRGQKLIAVTCHYDVLDWLQPDWVFQPATGEFNWRSLQGRPPIRLKICRVPYTTWEIFKRHHYLTASIHKASTCFMAFWDETPVAFDAWLTFYGRLKYGQAKRGHRTVCLPDYQGVGIGNALFTFCASLWSGLGYRAFSNTGHPAEIARRVHSDVWRLTRAPARTARGKHSVDVARAYNRLTASFEYCGAPLDKAEAERCLNAWAV